MKRGILAATISAALVLAAPAAPAHGRSYAWVANNCFDDHHAVSYWKRSDGRAYGFVAAGEGYDYAGGCWNNDDRDDTPPVATDDPGSEGPDRSGLVFKAWFLIPVGAFFLLVGGGFGVTLLVVGGFPINLIGVGVFLICALWEVLVQTAHCLLPQRWVRRRTPPVRTKQ